MIKPAEPDFTLISLPTALRLPQFKSAFRVTHRFVRRPVAVLLLDTPAGRVIATRMVNCSRTSTKASRPLLCRAS